MATEKYSYTKNQLQFIQEATLEDVSWAVSPTRWGYGFQQDYRKLQKIGHIELPRQSAGKYRQQDDNGFSLVIIVVGRKINKAGEVTMSVGVTSAIAHEGDIDEYTSVIAYEDEDGERGTRPNPIETHTTVETLYDAEQMALELVKEYFAREYGTGSE